MGQLAHVEGAAGGAEREHEAGGVGDRELPGAEGNVVRHAGLRGRDEGEVRVELQQPPQVHKEHSQRMHDSERHAGLRGRLARSPR